jgi:DNA-binding transcriptional MerR regulator
VDTQRFSIEELADAAGLTRRGIRFYVQQRLLPAPHGVGRGKHYDATHLERLRQVRDLQSAGHSLEEIRRILEGGVPEARGDDARRGNGQPDAVPQRSTPAPLRAELWRRLRIMDGVELSFDAARHNPTVDDLIKLRDLITATFRNQ